MDLQFIGDDRVAGENFQYTFATNQAYLDANAGIARNGYTTLQQTFGDLNLNYSSRFYGFFVQDDWQILPNIKLLYGLRYDLFDVPEARPFAGNPYSNDFTIDKNNWGPRAGVSWSIDAEARTVVRASTGKMFEPPLIDFYDNSILNNGDPLRYNVNVSGYKSPERRRSRRASPIRARSGSCCRGRASPRWIRTSGRSRRG